MIFNSPLSILQQSLLSPFSLQNITHDLQRDGEDDGDDSIVVQYDVE
jgi:hypothetical protein